MNRITFIDSTPNEIELVQAGPTHFRLRLSTAVTSRLNGHPVVPPAAGATGETGETGLQGPKGDPGKRGPPGLAGQFPDKWGWIKHATTGKWHEIVAVNQGGGAYSWGVDATEYATIPMVFQTGLIEDETATTYQMGMQNNAQGKPTLYVGPILNQTYVPLLINDDTGEVYTLVAVPVDAV